MVGKANAKADEATQPWRTLLAEIEANLEAVARSVESGRATKHASPTQGFAPNPQGEQQRENPHREHTPPPVCVDAQLAARMWWSKDPKRLKG